MASRSDLLHRLAASMSRPGVDGVLATPDILEDLLLLGALENKVVIGSMNRGGLQGASFELDDRFTAYSAAHLASRGIEGGKMLTRIDLNDDRTAATLQSSARAVTDLAEHRLMALIEPFWSVRRDGRLVNLLDPDSVIKSIHVASGLGATSAYTWLKLPVVDDPARVMDATALPTLLLGGDPADSPQKTYASLGRGADAALGARPRGGTGAAVPAQRRCRGRRGRGRRTGARRGVMTEWFRKAGTAGRTGFDVAIGPREAGWEHTGLYVVTLAAGESRRVIGGEHEWLVLPLSGQVQVECAGKLLFLSGRPGPFAGTTDFAYVPVSSIFTHLQLSRGTDRLASCQGVKTVAHFGESLPKRLLSSFVARDSSG